jgi:TolB protein
MKNILKTFTFSYILIFCFCMLNASDIKLGISSGNSIKETERRQFLLVNDFKTDNQNLSIIRQNIIKNLNIENIFKIEKTENIQKEFLNDNDWISRNIDYKIDGHFNNQNKNISIQLFFTKNNEKILDKNYEIKSLNDNSLKILANNISDEIYFLITGYRGLFSTKIAFSYTSTGIVKEIYSIDYSGDNFQKITNNNSISILPSFHPKKNRILYTSYQFGNPDLFIYDINLKEKRTISNKQGLNTTASFNPKGDKIVLTMTIKGNPDIVILDQSGNFIENITKNRFIDISPTWEKDGNKIAFISDRTGITQIYIYDLLTQQTYPITFDTKFKDSLDWSPTNNEIVFSCIDNGKFEIYKINTETKKQIQLTEYSGNNEDPSWSPDGRFICFTSTRNGKKDLFVMNSDGSSQRKIFTSNGEISCPKWSPSYE